MLNPYLLPPELPETELSEPAGYAMSFADRNDYELLSTLMDINATIFREYEYKQGATRLSTTAFEVYTNRYGVCQDFTNLFICLARLLGVPARYVCGYIITPVPRTPTKSRAKSATPGSRSTCRKWGGRALTRPTAFSRRPITCAWR